MNTFFSLSPHSLPSHALSAVLLTTAAVILLFAGAIPSCGNPVEAGLPEGAAAIRGRFLIHSAASDRSPRPGSGPQH